MTIYEILSLAINIAILILTALSYLKNKQSKKIQPPSFELLGRLFVSVEITRCLGHFLFFNIQQLILFVKFINPHRWLTLSKPPFCKWTANLLANFFLLRKKIPFITKKTCFLEKVPYNSLKKTLSFSENKLKNVLKKSVQR